MGPRPQYLWPMQLVHRSGKPDLSILVVSYNCPDDVAKCLASIQAGGAAGLDWEFLLCENGTERLPEIRGFAKAQGIRLIESPENLGFGKANNLLASQANGRFLLCLNPDTIVKPDVLTQLVRHLENHPECGACGPLLENPDGSLQDGWGEPTSLLWDACEAHYLQGIYRKIAWNKKLRSSKETWNVGFVSGACICLKASLWDNLGGYDPEFFLNHEDVELCDRIRSHNLQIHVLSTCRIVHAEGLTQRTNWRRYTFHRQQAKWIYIRKRYTGISRVLARLIWWESILLKYSLGLMILQNNGRSRLPGFLDAMRWVAFGKSTQKRTTA